VRAVKQPQPNGGAGRPARLRDEDRELALHDLTLEREVLGACMLMPELIMPSEVVAGDFYSDANGVVWSTLLKLVADGVEPIDTSAVRGALHESNRLQSIGGDEYLLSLTDTIPHRHIDTKRLRRLACRRRVFDAARLVQARAGTDELPRALDVLDRARLELENIDREAKAVPTLAELALALGAVGPRLPVGLKSLDSATRGGVPLGRLLMLLGAPGASKTNFSTWLADGWERAGCAVAFVASDESREAIVTRFGQLDGHDRDALEGTDPGRRQIFARSSAGRSIMVVDPSDDGLVLEDVGHMLATFAGDKPRVLFVDSLQTVPCGAAMQLETTRERLEATIAVCRRISRTGTLVVAISEMSRAGYRTGKRDQDIGALGAGAESRAIEYQAHLLIGMRPVLGEKGQIDLEIAKNRLGHEKLEIRAMLDFASLQWREISKPVDDEVQREIKRSVSVRAAVVDAVRKGEHRSINALVRACGVRKRDTASMVRELEAEGVLSLVGGVYRLASQGGKDD
jgi:KaiC/GvpD/RAD55 family RecA-like ATPase